MDKVIRNKQIEGVVFHNRCQISVLDHTIVKHLGFSRIGVKTKNGNEITFEVTKETAEFLIDQLRKEYGL